MRQGYGSRVCLVVHQAQWDAYDPSAPGGFPDWLPTFYGSVESATESEARWLAPVLPARASELAGALAAAVFIKIDKSFRMRLSNALESGAQPCSSFICSTRQ